MGLASHPQPSKRTMETSVIGALKPPIAGHGKGGKRIAPDVRQPNPGENSQEIDWSQVVRRYMDLNDLSRIESHRIQA